MSDRDPRMLPGISASTALARFVGAVLLSTLIWLLVFIAGCVFGNRILNAISSPGLAIGVLFGTIFGVAAVGTALSFREYAVAKSRKRRELAAGYTTLLTQFDQVDGIDSKTGAVVRPAKPRVAQPPGAGSFSTGREIGPSQSGVSALRVVLKLRGAIAGTVTAAVATYIAFDVLIEVNSGLTDLVENLLIVGGSLAFVALVVIPTVAASRGPEMFYRRFLSSQLAGDRVLATQTSTAFGDLLGELLPADAQALDNARPRLTCYLDFGADHLTFYSRHRSDLLPFLVIPRARIISTRMDVNTRSRGPSIPVVVLALRKDDGSSIEVRLQFLPEASWIPGKVVSELTADNEWVAAWASGKAPATA